MMNWHNNEAGQDRSPAGLCTDFFSLILHLRATADWDEHGDLRKRIMLRFEAMKRKGKEIGWEDKDLQEAIFALTAFIDETILNSSWRYKEIWRAKPLQLEYFGTNVAGQEFFERLERARQKRETKADLLEVYYLCLALGFEGKFKLLGKEELAKVIDGVAQDLRQAKLSTLSPGGQRPDEIVAKRRFASLFSWIVVLICALVAVLFSLVMSGAISQKADEVKDAAKAQVARIIREHDNNAN
jgi:type VI secretion system protein ImpK